MNRASIIKNKSRWLKIDSLLTQSVKLKLSALSRRAFQFRHRTNRRFSAVLMTTVVALVTVSVVVVLLVLNNFLGERVEAEFQKKLLAERGQVEILIENRLSEVRKLLEDFTSDNTIRVTMMLDAKSKLIDRIKQSYPPENGVYPFIQMEGTNSIFPENYLGLPNESARLAIYARLRGDVLPIDGVPRLLWLFSKPITGNGGSMGTAAIVYDMTGDSVLKTAIQEAVGGDIVISYRDALYSLTQNLAAAPDYSSLGAIRDSGRSLTFMGDTAVSRVPASRHLYFLSPSEDLKADRRKVAILMVVFSAFILGISTLIALILSGKMVRPLKEMTRKAIQISEGSDTRPVFEKSSHYWEFNQLSQAFNTMLSNLKDAEERSRYQELLENVDDAVYILDKQGAIIEANTATYTTLGYSKEEFLNIGLDAFVAAPGVRTILEQYSEASNTLPTKKMTIETVHKGKNGHLIPVEIRSHLITYLGKQVILNVARDISKRIETEKEKKQLETQLFHALKLEAMGTMAGCIAHDFNNLVMGIQGRLSLMQLNLDTEHPCTRHLDELHKTVTSATALIKQLLGFARKEEGEILPVDINTLVDESTRLFIRSRKEIELRCDYARDIWPVKADRGQLEQVLVNLYVNAWQAMPDGGNIGIHTRNIYLEDTFCKSFGVQGGGYVNINISDTGTGIPKDIIDKVFDPFFTTKEAGKGTGLGLSSAYGIIRNHDGIITVKSEMGKGTAFDIYLPSSSQESTERIQATCGR